MSVVKSLIVPGMPHPLLTPDANPGWRRIRNAYEAVAASIATTDADLLVIYSTQWPSVIGHQIQADPAPEWTHVDQEFHDLGSISYKFRMDPEFAEAVCRSARNRGLHARTVAYRGFPIDTGTIIALSLLNPGNRLPATVLSCNMYADRAETVVLGKATRDAIEATGRKAIGIAVTAISSRQHTAPIAPADDHVSSESDNEWNQKLLEFLDEGRLEDVSQLARTFAAQAHADSKMKGVWWLGAVSGQTNNYAGKVHAYAPIWGTGAAVVELTPSSQAAADQEFDEDDVEVYGGDRGVLQDPLHQLTCQATL